MAVCGGGRLEGIYLLPGEGIAGQVVNSGEPLVISDCRQDDRWTGKVDTETGYITRTVLCVPLKTEGMAFGALQLINKAGCKPFDGQDLAFVEELARQISLIVQGHPLLAEYHSGGGRQTDTGKRHRQKHYRENLHLHGPCYRPRNSPQGRQA